MEIDARAGDLLRWRGAGAKKVWVGFSAPEVKGAAAWRGGGLKAA
jgi:hypothetical protein